LQRAKNGIRRFPDATMPVIHLDRQEAGVQSGGN